MRPKRACLVILVAVDPRCGPDAVVDQRSDALLDGPFLLT